MSKHQQINDWSKIKYWLGSINQNFCNIKMFFLEFEKFEFEEDKDKNKLIHSFDKFTNFNAYVSAISTCFYAFYDTLNDFEKIHDMPKNIKCFLKNDDIECLLKKLIIPREINNYLKHTYDYWQKYVNKITDYLYKKMHVNIAYFLTKNGNFDEDNFNYGKRLLYECDSNEFRPYKIERIIDVYEIFTKTKIFYWIL